MSVELSNRQKELLEKLRSGQARIKPLEAEVVRLAPGAKRPLSQAQGRIVFEEELYPGNTFNGSLSVDFKGVLDIDQLRCVMDLMVARHDILRSNVKLDEGGLTLVVRAAGAMPLEVIDLTHQPYHSRLDTVARLGREFVGQPINIYCDPVLIRTAVFRVSANEYVIVLAMHMFAFDAPSGAILIDEIIKAYDALGAGRTPELVPLPYQYSDYVAWERERATPVRGEALAYWQDHLKGQGAPAQLPCDGTRSDHPIFDAARFPFKVPAELASALKRLARTHGLSFYMVLLAALQVLLFRHSDRPDVAVGAWAVQRNPKNAHLIGPFVNTIVYRSMLDGAWSFEEVLSRVKEVARAAYTHGTVPFEEVVAAVQPRRNSRFNPLFQVHFILQELGSQQERCGFRLSPLDALIGAAGGYDIELVMRDLEWGLEGHFELNSGLFSEEAGNTLVDRYGLVLHAISSNPRGSIGSISLGKPPPSESEPLIEKSLEDWLAEGLRSNSPMLVRSDGETLLRPEGVKILDQLGAALVRDVAPGKCLLLLAKRGGDAALVILAALRCAIPLTILDAETSIDRLRSTLAALEVGACWLC
ncbi:MAG: condensation domain-containing protein, partial [Polynucleobacter sp.]|nr:condensation domain-containing protein [Polynucleobacter sp.]